MTLEFSFPILKMSLNTINGIFHRSLVVRAAGTKSGGRGLESHIGHDGDWVGQATDRDSSTKRM